MGVKHTFSKIYVEYISIKTRKGIYLQSKKLRQRITIIE